MNDRILILYGSGTGNSEICTARTFKELCQHGFDPVEEDMAQVKLPLLQDFGPMLEFQNVERVGF